jgi:carbon monoxide dehydrogenase subunit G
MAAIPPFAGEQHLPFPPERVFAALRELEAVARRMPDVASVERVDGHTLKLVVKPGFSFLRGTLRVTMSVEETAPGRSLVQTARSEGIGMSMTIRSEISLSSAEGGTAAAWRAEVTERKGLVAAVGASLIQAAANKVLADGWSAVSRTLEETA